MPTNKPVEDALNEWARNWRKQQEEMSYQPQYRTQNQTPYYASAPNRQQTPYPAQSRPFAPQSAVQSAPQPASQETSVLSPEDAQMMFQKGVASKTPGFFSKDRAMQTLANVGDTALKAALPEYTAGKALYKTGENIGKGVASYNAVNAYPFQKDDVTYDKVSSPFTSWNNMEKFSTSAKYGYDLYNELTPFKFNDKYKHALLNCKLGQKGDVGAWTADIASRGKEFLDVVTGGNTLSESYADMQANLLGRKLGYNNHNGDCDQMVQQYYPKYYPKK